MPNPKPYPSEAPSRRTSTPSPIGGATYYQSDAFAGLCAIDGRDFETRLPPHVHSPYVIGVVESGVLRVTVNGRSLVAGPGSVVALPPFTVHTELPMSDNGWSFHYLYPSETVVREALGVARDGGGAALPFANPVIEDAALAQSIRRVRALLSQGAATGHVEDALVRVFRRARERHCGASPHEASELACRRGVLAVRALLTTGPVRGVTLSDLARVAGLSLFRFVRVFHAEIGLPPYAYYERVRIAFAHQMIQQGADLSAVAYRLGYADQSHLTRHFRRASFTTPGQLADMARRAGHGRAAVD